MVEFLLILVIVWVISLSVAGYYQYRFFIKDNSGLEKEVYEDKIYPEI
jgi:hypothetical protein